MSQKRENETKQHACYEQTSTSAPGKESPPLGSANATSCSAIAPTTMHASTWNECPGRDPAQEREKEQDEEGEQVLIRPLPTQTQSQTPVHFANEREGEKSQKTKESGVKRADDVWNTGGNSVFREDSEDTVQALSRYKTTSSVVKTHSVFLDKRIETKKKQSEEQSNCSCRLVDVRTLTKSVCLSPMAVASVVVLIVGSFLTEAALERSRRIFEDDLVTTLEQEMQETGRIARSQVTFFSESKLIHIHLLCLRYLRKARLYAYAAHTLFSRTFEGEVAERAASDDLEFYTSGEWPGFRLGMSCLPG